MELKIYLQLFEICDHSEMGHIYGSMLRDSCKLFRMDSALHLLMNLPSDEMAVQSSKATYTHVVYGARSNYRCTTFERVEFDFNDPENGKLLIAHFLDVQSKDHLSNSHQDLHSTEIIMNGWGGEKSVFLVAAKRSEAQWKILKRRHKLEINILAEFFHQHLVAAMSKENFEVAPELTAREVEVLKMSGQGKTYIEIAKILNISSRTVRFFLENVRQKLGCRNTTHAVAFAIQNGLI